MGPAFDLRHRASTRFAGLVSPKLRGSVSGLVPPKLRSSEGGFTFVELLVVCTILLILASAVMPLARVTVQRQRE